MQSHAPDTTYNLLQDIEQLLTKIISKLIHPRISPEGECESITFYGAADDFMIDKTFLDFKQVKGTLHLITVLQKKYQTLPENYIQLKIRDEKNLELKKY